MQPDPALVSETRAWFKRAAEDLRAAGHALRADPPLLEDDLEDFVLEHSPRIK